MFNNFSEEARKVIVTAKEEMKNLKHPYVSSEHLLLALLKDKEISLICDKYHLNYQKLKKEIINIIGVGKTESLWFLYTPLLKQIIESAIIDSKEHNIDVTPKHLFKALLEENDGVALRILSELNIDVEGILNEIDNPIKQKKKKQKKLTLLDYGYDLNQKVLNNEIDPVIGREKETKRILEVLSRRCKNNPILIGEAGVGKTAIVENLSKLIVDGNVPNSIKNKRIISLNMSNAVAGTKYRGEFEERMNKIIKEVEENDDIILFIDEIHTLVGAGGAEGAIDASNIFKPALARGKLRLIGATTIEEYKKYIEKDNALNRRFQKVEIKTPTNEETKNILLNIKKIYEKYHNVIINDDIVNLIVDLSEKYIYDRFEPDKSLDILDEVCAKVSLNETKDTMKIKNLKEELKKIKEKKHNFIMQDDYKKASKYKQEENKIMDKINNLELETYNKSEVTESDVAEIFHSKTNIPVYEILNENKLIIKNIEEKLKADILDQDEAISKVINTVKKIKLGYNDKNKCHSFLFVGPSGVGKTALSKDFGECLVGENNIIKLDMSEYSEPQSISKIIGSSPGYVGYDDNYTVLEMIRNKPYSVLILDEIEKASMPVINLFYQILEDGQIKDSKGRKIRFDNVTIVMTSNVGFEDIYVGFKHKTKNNIMSKLKEYFNLAFINRIDEIVIFNKLNESSIEKLIRNKISDLKNKYRNVNININKKVVNQIIEKSNYNEFGARKIEKIIKDDIENIVIDKLINNEEKINIDSICTIKN